MPSVLNWLIVFEIPNCPTNINMIRTILESQLKSEILLIEKPTAPNAEVAVNNIMNMELSELLASIVPEIIINIEAKNIKIIEKRKIEDDCLTLFGFIVLLNVSVFSLPFNVLSKDIINIQKVVVLIPPVVEDDPAPTNIRTIYVSNVAWDK